MTTVRSTQAASRTFSLPALRRAVIVASVLALTVTSFDARAASPIAAATPAKQPSINTASADIEFGARKRSRSRGNNNAAGLAMMGLMIGTIGAVIAAEQRRDAYRDAYNARYYRHHGYPYGGYGGYGAYAPAPVVRHHYRHHHHYGHAPVIAPRAYHHHGAPDFGPVKRAW